MNHIPLRYLYRYINLTPLALMGTTLHLTACNRPAPNNNPHKEALKRMERQRKRDAYNIKQVEQEIATRQAASMAHAERYVKKYTEAQKKEEDRKSLTK